MKIFTGTWFMEKSKPIIAILNVKKTAPNMENVLDRFYDLLAEKFELHLIINSSETNIINKYKDKYALFPVKQRFTFNADFYYYINSLYQYFQIHKPACIMNIGVPHILGLPIIIMSKIYKIRSVIRMPGDTFGQLQFTKSYFDKIKYFILHHVFAKYAFYFADYVIPLNEYLKSSLLKHGIDEEKIFVMLQPFKYFEILKYKKKRIASTKKNVVFIGRISYLKGADRLLNILQQLSELGLDEKFKFTVIGEGPYRSDLVKYDGTFVEAKGKIKNTEALEILSNADVFLHLSRTEGFPHVILEALVLEVPIITMPVADVHNIVSNVAYDEKECVSLLLKDNLMSDKLPEYAHDSHLKSTYNNFFNFVTKSTD